MNKILKIDTDNLLAIVEPGVINEEFQIEVEKFGLFYPPDPASMGSCTLGGNIAENSGGPRAVKYGVTKEYVLNLEVVLANGEVVQTGANVIKNATGYDLTHLITGSEGTLGIITRATLKLIPKPKHSVLLCTAFNNPFDASAMVGRILQSGYMPRALEFMEYDAVKWTADFSGIPAPINLTEGNAMLLVEFDGNNMDAIRKEADEVAEMLFENEALDVLFADESSQKEQLWKLRRRVGEAVKSNSVYKEEDTVVPRNELPVLLKEIKRIGEEYGFKSVCYGHAGDGNLHINIIKGNMPDEKWNTELTTAIREIFSHTVRLGGTISGEHGIGLVQKEYMDIPFKQSELELMKSIKRLFDPKNILNPGKIF